MQKKRFRRAEGEISKSNEKLINENKNSKSEGRISETKHKIPKTRKLIKLIRGGDWMHIS
jgi:hypothetical protein